MHSQLCLLVRLVFAAAAFADAALAQHNKTYKSIRFDLTLLLLPMFTSSLLFDFFSPLDFRSSFAPFMMLLLKIL
jgi:hypothetical protein